MSCNKWVYVDQSRHGPCDERVLTSSSGESLSWRRVLGMCSPDSGSTHPAPRVLGVLRVCQGDWLTSSLSLTVPGGHNSTETTCALGDELGSIAYTHSFRWCTELNYCYYTKQFHSCTSFTQTTFDPALSLIERQQWSCTKHLLQTHNCFIHSIFTTSHLQ